MPPTIRLRIDTLVLDGLPVAPADTPALRRAIEAALAERLATSGVGSEFSTGVALDRLRAATIELRPGATPTTLGTRIGQALAGGLIPR
jgi:hypothetical protein